MSDFVEDPEGIQCLEMNWNIFYQTKILKQNYLFISLPNSTISSVILTLSLHWIFNQNTRE